MSAQRVATLSRFRQFLIPFARFPKEHPVLNRNRETTRPSERRTALAGSRVGLRTASQRAIIALLLLATFFAGVGADRLGVLGGTSADASSSMTNQPQF